MKLFPLDLAKNTDELKKLISENPDLPIVVLAGQDLIDGEQTTYCGDLRFYVDEILDCEVPYMEYVETDRVNFEEQIEEWLWDEMGGNDKGSNLSETFLKMHSKKQKQSTSLTGKK